MSLYPSARPRSFQLPLPDSRRDYLVHVSAKLGCVYVEVPKTGCTTIKRLLQLGELEGDADRAPRDPHDRSSSPLTAPGADLAAFQRLWDDPATLRFTYVRNPYTRILSCYLDKIVTNQWERQHRLPKLGLDPDADVPLLQFLEIVAAQPQDELDIHWCPQFLLTGVPHNHYDREFHFERFTDVTIELLGELGLGYLESHVAAKPAHATEAGDLVEQYIGDDEAALIHEIYADDFVLFGYSTDLARCGEPPAFVSANELAGSGGRR